MHLIVTAAVIGVLIVVNLLNNKVGHQALLDDLFRRYGVLDCDRPHLWAVVGGPWSCAGYLAGRGVLVGRGVWCGGAVLRDCSEPAIDAQGFGDKRAAEQGWTSVLYESTIRILFGTRC